MEKNNKILIIVIVILSIWVAVLSGFFIYDKVLDKKEPEVKEPAKDTSSTTTPTPQTPVKEDHSVILNGGWYQNDADVIKVDYESVKNEGTVNGLRIKYDKDYSPYEKDVELGWMEKEESYDDVYTINDKITFMNVRHECGAKHKILLVDSYIVIYCVTCNGTGTIEIYDKNNNLVKETRHGFQENSDESKLEPVVHNHKLYFYGYHNPSEGEKMITSIKYIDLTTKDLTETTLKSW